MTNIGIGVAGQSFAISPCEPERLNYYVYVYFLNTASSSRCLDGPKKSAASVFGILTFFVFFAAPLPGMSLYITFLHVSL